MRKIVLFLALVLLASSGRALAQAGGNCPTDVGAAIAAACPCDTAGNHGKYVSCVARFRNDLRRRGCLDDAAKRTITSCAARSTCGKDGAKLCCVYDTSGTCNDPIPGDGTAAGTCSNDATRVCDTDTDCITATGPTVSRHAERCTDRGGTVVGTGSVCSSCPIPPPAP